MRAARSVASRRPSHPSPRPRGGYHGQGEPCGLTPRTARLVRKETTQEETNMDENNHNVEARQQTEENDETTHCQYCDAVKDEDELVECCECTNRMCDDCAHHCADCDTPICEDCAHTCERCDDIICDECSRWCDGCDWRYAATASNTARSAAQATAHHAWRNTTTTRTHRSQTT